MRKYPAMYHVHQEDIRSQNPEKRLAIAVIARMAADLQYRVERFKEVKDRLDLDTRKLINIIKEKSFEDGGFMYWLHLAFPSEEVIDYYTHHFDSYIDTHFTFKNIVDDSPGFHLE